MALRYRISKVNIRKGMSSFNIVTKTAQNKSINNNHNFLIKTYTTLVCKDDQSEPLCICLATIILS